MIKVIKHGTAFHAYKCSKCDCIFTASKRDIEIEDINGLLYCPECGYYIFEHDIIDDKKNKSRSNQCTFMLESWRA